MLSMSEGVDLIGMVTQIQRIKSKDELPALAMMLRAAGDEAGANFIENWLISLEYHIKAEWDNYGRSDKMPNHMAESYPDCVEKGCIWHPYLM